MRNADRARRLGFLALFLFGLIAVHLVWMQVVKGSYYRDLSEKNRLRVVYLEGARGRILDRKGNALALNRLSFNCSAVSWVAEKKISESCRMIAPILGEDAWTLEKRFFNTKPSRFNTVLLGEDIGLEKAMAIEERLESLPGFMIETRPQRIYPLAEASAHLLGFIGPIRDDEEDLVNINGYKWADWVGRDGVEKFYENYLRGRSGGIQAEVNSRGRFVRALGVERPRFGKDLELTIDAQLQKMAQGLLDKRRGAVAVMDLKTGGLLSMNSAPSFDPNLFATARGRKDVGRYLVDPASPMVNRLIRGRYPPGSIFKIVTALAGLQEKKANPGRTFHCSGITTIGGKEFHCWNLQGHGAQALTQALAHSCNVYFYSLALLTGPDALSRKAVEFGFAKLTGIDLPGEKEGTVPSRDWKRKTLRAGWYDGDTANFAIGQGYLQVTPLQALSMVATVAREGQILKPHVAHKISGMVVAPVSQERVHLSSSDLNAVMEGLEAVIHSTSGTGRLARVEGLSIAGKTGTAQAGQGKTHAWFVGYAPADDPQIAMVVFLEHGGRGGVSAATLASSIFQWLKKAEYL
ncbi:MAG: penicillin-binding protein 2 [Candidatus Omnitrophica bacterium]|nr:penicillin-binding protein 2 [Candidatus Omnitrophota bacterium]